MSKDTSLPSGYSDWSRVYARDRSRDGKRVHTQTGDHLTEPNWVDRTLTAKRDEVRSQRLIDDWEIFPPGGEPPRPLDEQSDASRMSAEDLRDKAGKNRYLDTIMSGVATAMEQDERRRNQPTTEEAALRNLQTDTNDETGVFDSNVYNPQLGDEDPLGLNMTAL